MSHGAWIALSRYTRGKGEKTGNKWWNDIRRRGGGIQAVRGIVVHPRWASHTNHPPIIFMRHRNYPRHRDQRIKMKAGDKRSMWYPTPPTEGRMRKFGNPWVFEVDPRPTRRSARRGRRTFLQFVCGCFLVRFPPPPQRSGATFGPGVEKNVFCVCFRGKNLRVAVSKGENFFPKKKNHPTRLFPGGKNKKTFVRDQPKGKNKKKKTKQKKPANLPAVWSFVYKRGNQKK